MHDHPSAYQKALPRDILEIVDGMFHRVWEVFNIGPNQVLKRPLLTAVLTKYQNPDSTLVARASQFPKYSTSTKAGWMPVSILTEPSVTTFRKHAYESSRPFIIASNSLRQTPAIKKWFLDRGDDSSWSSPNYEYLSQFSTALVSLEVTLLQSINDGGRAPKNFYRSEAPLSLFLEWTRQSQCHALERMYLAQASTANLPKALNDDLPIPEIVTQTGKGDIYGTNLWIGVPPTYTPLHRDPNPNLFVQLVGEKVVRLMEPSNGQRLYGEVQTSLGRIGLAKFRGEEMMKGEEHNLLEAQVWNKSSDKHDQTGYEAHLHSGDGLFIPLGWWHSVRGIGAGITGSVNWWFR